MAKNRIFASGRQLTLAVAAGVLSGAPVLVGAMTGVALEDRDSAGKAPVDFDGVYELSVKGANDAGNTPIALGEPIYYVDGDTPKLSKKASGYFFGFALEPVNSAATTTIRVVNVQGPGPGTADILAGAIGTAELAAKAVTAAKAPVFVSAEQTGDGNPQNVAHGLAAVPSLVLVVPTVLTDAAAETGFSLVEGAHDATNCVVTATNTVKYKVMAWA